MSATGMIARTSGVLLAGIGEIQVTTGLKGYALSGEMLGYSDRVNRTLSGAHNTTAGFRIANRGLRLNQKGNMMIRDAITQQNILKGGTGVVKTPYGDAVQSLSKEAKTVKTSIENGGTVYRGGTLGRSNASEGQYWAPENPLNLGHADRYGVDFGKLILLLVVKSNRIQILSQDQHLV
ncbi:hypothetical protein SDC9_118772 [bioreactor metagenome]|uniref:Uncharacterized protein n=1 Tax=bioreactor metagenome TaxID=1076179 RepID=A0A645C4B0_9ZZZZ